ncbi:MAG: putative histidine kinase, hybrid [Massilia sp.]|nr:putative histidine kinase, hybrid [Massilia sp.]
MMKPRNLNQALSLLLFFVTVPLLLGALALLVAQARHERQLAQNQLGALAKTLVQAVDRELDHGKAQLEVLAASGIIDERDWSALHAYGREITRNRPGSLIALIGPGGEQLINTAVPKGQPLPNLWAPGRQHEEAVWEGHKLPLSSQSLTRTVFDKNQVVYSDLYYGLLIKRPTLALSVPVVRQGQVAYALLLSFPPVLIERLIRESVDAPGLRAVVTDRRWTVVASNHASASSMGGPTSQLPIPAGSMSGFYEATSRDGTRLQGAYAVSAVNGFLVRVAFPAASLGNAWTGVSAAWMLLVVGMLLVSILLVGSLGRRLARPLRELGEAVQSGQPPEGKPSGIAEIDLLAQALRAGALAERKRRDELVISTQRQQAELELRKADRQKDEFLATLAHELRNPLAPISSSAALLTIQFRDEPRIRQAGAIISRQVKHMSRLIDDLLDVSRVTRGLVTLQVSEVDMNEVVRSALDQNRPLIEEKSHRIDVQLPPQPVTVQGDATRLIQAVANILNNAAKYTPPAGTIGVLLDVHERGDEARRVRVQVRDNGSGMPPELLPSVFELFTQGARTLARSQGGLGLGLALVRKLIELHGGTVAAHSDGVGLGSVFTIELPCGGEETGAGGHPALPHRIEAAAYRPLRVIIVDDNEDAADSLAMLLRAQGHTVLVEYNAAAALRRAIAERPDAMVVDIGLPDMDGYQLAALLRKQAETRGAVLIAATGYGLDRDRERALAAGFAHHLVKPVDMAALVRILQAVASRGEG